MNTHLLGLELARRGLTWSDLGRLGHLSKPTRARLRSGKPTSAGVLRRVDAVLRSVPVLEEVAGLLVDDSEDERTASGLQALAVAEDGNGPRLQARV